MLQTGWVKRVEPVELAGGEVRWNVQFEFQGEAKACGDKGMRVGRVVAFSALPLSAEVVDMRHQAQAAGAAIDYAFVGAHATPWTAFRGIADDAEREAR